MPHLRRSLLGRAAAGTTLLSLLVAGSASAHVVVPVGTYSLAIGWAHEPVYVGSQNAVQVIIKDAAGKPVADVAADALSVVVSTGGKQSAALALVPMYDTDTGLGIAGDYEAPIMPTAPGDYTFHVTGAIHGTKVDQTETSSDSTFNSAVEATSIQFPVTLPSVGEVVTRLDRIDARIAAQPSPAPAVDISGIQSAVSNAGQTAGGAQATAVAAQAAAADAKSAAASATAAASAARDAATQALALGVVIGVIAAVIAIAALWVAFRGRRSSAG
jgi:hypothetical protein